jgi:hypothetical protein
LSVQIHLIRTPLRDVGGMTYGGPMRIRIGPRRVAYAGFATAALAQTVCRYWNLPVEHFVEPWDEAMRHERPESRAREVLLFRDEGDFRRWLEDPGAFRADGHVVTLHPASLPRAPERAL